MLIESGQALFRGESYYFPQELWSVKEQKWVPYQGRIPKKPAWGDIISQGEAEEFKKPV